MDKQYEDLARAAYENCKDLLVEANLLFDNQAYPRSYSLSILAVEEFAKSILCKVYAAGIITDKRFVKDLQNHRVKLVHFIRIAAATLEMSERKAELNKLIEEEEEKKRKSQKRRPMMEMLATILNDPVKLERISRVFSNANSLKKDGFYVGLVGGKIIKPSEKISEERAKEALDILNPSIYNNEGIFDLSDKQVRGSMLILDPELLTGSIWPASLGKRQRG